MNIPKAGHYVHVTDEALLVKIRKVFHWSKERTAYYVGGGEFPDQWQFDDEVKAYWERLSELEKMLSIESFHPLYLPLWSPIK